MEQHKTHYTTLQRSFEDTSVKRLLSHVCARRVAPKLGSPRNGRCRTGWAAFQLPRTCWDPYGIKTDKQSVHATIGAFSEYLHAHEAEKVLPSLGACNKQTHRDRFMRSDCNESPSLCLHRCSLNPTIILSLKHAPYMILSAMRCGVTVRLLHYSSCYSSFRSALPFDILAVCLFT